MAANNLLFTFLSGLVLLGIVAAVLSLRNWRRGSTSMRPSTTPMAAAASVLHSPRTWTAAFFVLVLLAVGGALAMVGAVPLPEGTQPVVTTALLAGAGLVLAGFVFLGVYASVRGRGYGSAPAVGLGSLSVGLLALVVVVTQLFLG